MFLQRLRAYADACAAGSNQGADPTRLDRKYDSTEFALLLEAVSLDLPRYQSSHPAPLNFDVGNLDLRHEMTAFLERTSFHEALIRGMADTDQVVRDFRSAAARPDCGIENLIILDGLEAPVNELTVRGVRLVRLNEQRLNDFFSGPLPGSIPADRLMTFTRLKFLLVGTIHRGDQRGLSGLRCEFL